MHACRPGTGDQETWIYQGFVDVTLMWVKTIINYVINGWDER